MSSKFQLLAGYASALGAVVTYATSTCCVQALQGAIPDFQLSVVRSIIQMVLYIIGGKLTGAEFTIKDDNIPALLYLGVAYMAINVGSYGASTYLPLAEVSGIVIIALIVSAFLHARLAFNKEITKSNIISLTVCAVGIILTIQPSWLFKYETIHNCSTDSENVTHIYQLLGSPDCSGLHISKGGALMGYILSIIGGVGAGVTYDISGIMLHDVRPAAKATYAALFCTLGSVVFMFYLEDPALKITSSQVMLVLGHAVLSSMSSFLTIQSGHYVRGPSVSLVYSLEVVTMLLFQYTIMHSIMPGNYNGIEVLGCTMILIGASIPATIDVLANYAKADELP